MQLALGPVKIDPFATGRATFYDDKFEAFAASAGQPTETENVRLWGGGGVRVSTSVQRLDEDFSSDMFDIRGVRHIIEPSTTIMLSGTNRDATTLPVYDQRVEQLAQGTTARAGVANTWQTRRGGPGREHTVDFLKINTDYVYSANNTQRLSPIGQFVDYRPEYSLLGNLGVVDGVWQVTDSAALTGSTVYDLDLNQQARTSAGIKLDHSVDFSSFAELRFINPLNATYLDVGGQLRLTSKYTVAAVATYDTDRNKFQSAGSRVAREFPDVTFGLNVGINNITGDVSIGVDIRPLGQDSRAAMLQRLNRSRIDAGFGEPVEVQSRAGWFGGGGVGATRTTGDTSRPSYSGLP